MLRILNFSDFGNKIYESNGNEDKPDPSHPDADTEGWKKMSPSEISAKAEERIRNIKYTLSGIDGYPFYGILIKRLKVVESTTLKYKTMATNGRDLLYDPTFVMSHTTAEIRWVIIHELLHCVLGHFTRDKSDKSAWNAACDYALNQLIPVNDYAIGGSLWKKKGLKMPPGALGSPEDKMIPDKAIRDKFAGRKAEDIYNYIIKNNIIVPPDEGWNYGNVEPDIVVPGGKTGSGGGRGISPDRGPAKVGDYIKIFGGGWGKIISIENGEAEITPMTKDEIKKAIEQKYGQEVINIT